MSEASPAAVQIDPSIIQNIGVRSERVAAFLAVLEGLWLWTKREAFKTDGGAEPLEQVEQQGVEHDRDKGARQHQALALHRHQLERDAQASEGGRAEMADDG